MVARRSGCIAGGSLVPIALIGTIVLGDRAIADTRPPRSSASTPAPKDPKVETADRLFAEGKALFGSNLLQACAKFDESLRINSAAIGTLLNVALCDEKLGRIASAVAKFSVARDRAREQGLTAHAKAAEDHIAALQPDVPHLSIALTEMLPSTKVLVDDRFIPIAEISNVAIDPGEHEIVVNAPARLPHRMKVVISKTERKVIVIPALAQPVTITNTQRRIGQVTTLVGGLSMATGVAFGLSARALYKGQFGDYMPGNGRCDDTGRCESDGYKKTQDAHTRAKIATVFGAAGIAMTIAGVIIWATAPNAPHRESRTPELTVVPAITGDEVGVVATGRF